MTDTTIISAHPALDALVAERVMGWKRFTDSGDGTYWWIVDFDGDATRYTATHRVANWRPSRDISDAWRVLEVMMTVIPNRDIHLEHLGGEGWKVLSCHTVNGWREYGDESYSTVELAICAAALKLFNAMKTDE